MVRSNVMVIANIAIGGTSRRKARCRMQIVIEIPESIYDTIQSDEMISREQLAILQMHIMNGTPLPKGHGRLVDYDEMKKIANCYGEFTATTLSHIKPQVIIEADGGDTETWNGYHGQVTAPKGTFKRIYADADGGDAE